MKTKVIIIGGGPGGIFSAIYLKRFGIDSIIFEKNQIGGLSNHANLIENFPFLKPISGQIFVKKLKNIVNQKKLKIIYENAIKISFKNNFTLETNKNIYNSKYLILATGTIPIIPEEFKGLENDNFVLFKNFFNIRNKNIAIIGGGDAAFDYALNLSKRNNITIISRGIRAIQILVNRCLVNKNIKLIFPANVERILKENNKYNLILIKNKKKMNCIFDHILIACGRRTYYGDIKNIDKIIFKRHLKHRVFLCGDVKNGRFRQIINSVSDAMKIAMEIKEIEYDCKG